MVAVRTTIDLPPQTVDVEVDLVDGRTLLLMAGFPADKVDVAQAVATAESDWFADAVGDITLVSSQWGCSIGLFQIRSLRHPASFGGNDLWRYAWPLRQPFFNAQAALAISKGGTDWTPWSAFTSGNYTQHLGKNPRVKTGHTAASSWWK